MYGVGKLFPHPIDDNNEGVEIMYKTKFLDDTTMTNLINEIIDDIINLRDSSEHQISDFDLVIDKLRKIEGGLNYNSKEERLLYEQIDE